MIYLFINYVDFINKFCFISIINIFFYYNLHLIQIINFYLVNYLKLKKTKKNYQGYYCHYLLHILFLIIMNNIFIFFHK